jgi:transcriptional regulator
MYVPKHFGEQRIGILHEFIRSHSFGMLVSATSGGLDAVHTPFDIDPEPAPFGTLRGHVAHANPIWKQCASGVDALVVFQGPNAYITPSWYAAKKETGKVVPTWNYVAVHARGPLRVIHDRVWLRGVVEKLTDRHEATRPQPWKLSDAPPDFIEQMLSAIVGVEVPIVSLTGSWKLSQNRSAVDQHCVAQGLRAEGSASAAQVVHLMDRLKNNVV